MSNVMALWNCVCTFVTFAILQIIFADGLYFPTSVVNVTLPKWETLPRGLPPLVRLHAVADWNSQPADDIKYAIVLETTSRLFIIDGNELRLNEESFFTDDIVSKRQMVVVSARSGTRYFANSTINLFLTEDKLNCEKAKRHLCFWNGASFRVEENDEPVELGHLSSEFYQRLCQRYAIHYHVVKGGKEYFGVKKTPEDSWSLYSKNKIKDLAGTQVRFLVNCTVASEEKTETFVKDFDVTVVKKKKKINTNFKAIVSNVTHQNEKIAIWIINDLERRKMNLNFSLKNDTNDNFNLECWPKILEFFSETSYYKCEITAKTTIYLRSAYSVYIQVDDWSQNYEQPERLNITLQPLQLNFRNLSLSSWMNAEDGFILNLKYPEFLEISRKAVLGTRVAEPTLSGIDVRERVAASKIKFQILTPGPFNVTEIGGIVFVSNRYLIKEITYRIKITGVYPNGYRFFSTLQINVTDTKSLPGHEVCEKLINESYRPSCSEKNSRLKCEKTCGVSTGLLKRSDGKAPTTSGCSWRNNEDPSTLSKMYQTCSPDLLTCPDGFCDSLETLFPKICPQDCTGRVIGTGNKEHGVPGIISGTGVCFCETPQQCLCTSSRDTEPVKQSERRKSKQIINDTKASKHREAISAVKASYTDQCGAACLLFIAGGGVILVCGTFTILLMTYRRRMKKRCPNQGPLKEDMVNINYEEYVERPGDIIRPLTQNNAIKEIPEYYDKKWEFPRYRLTIEETIGEGEFGKVLKARADGIGGNHGSTTVAVKTLKDNAKDSELADLISEYQLLKEIDHPNVIHLLGACTKLDGPVYIIIEYAKHGSLRNYLRKHRHLTNSEVIIIKEGESNYVQPVTPKDILTFAWQIAKGMNYLTDMKLVHRDLAARNVLVAEGLICKISDFGLTRDIYEDDTYLKRSKGRVPVKWMALESLADHIYTTKSDVWSYGVVLWELVTTGASPYPGIAGQNLFHLLKSGYRMEKPTNCSGELYQILRSCWQENPSHRPTFKSLVAKLEEMLGEGKDYLDLNPRTVENKTYFSEFLNDEDELETFLPNQEPAEENGIFKVKFEMFEKPVGDQECNKCQLDKCVCETSLRYENENVPLKVRYENEGMEDAIYVQPTGNPKLVKCCQNSAETGRSQ